MAVGLKTFSLFYPVATYSALISIAEVVHLKNIIILVTIIISEITSFHLNNRMLLLPLCHLYILLACIVGSLDIMA